MGKEEEEGAGLDRQGHLKEKEWMTQVGLKDPACVPAGSRAPDRNCLPAALGACKGHAAPP